MYHGTFLVNDLTKINKTETLKKITENTRFSFSYVALLVGSGIVCTLGLLFNSAPAIIGGMIISPLMWPLMQTSIGISYGRIEYIKRALIILSISSAISLTTAFLISFVSPVKILNPEILARTTPTLVDVIIALVAGGVAALALTQPKISESLAGVAIATSLIPPLCVSGIGLALLNFQVFWGGLLMYATHIVSIVFISVLAFLWVGLKKSEEEDFQRHALEVTAFILFLLAIPLFILLRQFSYSTSAYSKANKTLQSEMHKLSQEARVSGLNLNVEKELVLIEAEVLVPEGEEISYEVRQSIQENLEHELKRPVELHLVIQKTASVLSKSDIEYSSTKESISKAFITKLSEIKPDLTIDTLDIYKNQGDEKWIISGILIGDPTIRFSYLEQQRLENNIKETANEEILLNIDILPRIRVQSRPEEVVAQIEQEIRNFTAENYLDLAITSLEVTAVHDEDNNLSDLSVRIGATLPQDAEFDPLIIEDLKSRLIEAYKAKVDFELQIVRVDNYKL